MTLTTQQRDRVTDCTKGTYQEGLLTSRENWSGSSLEGKAREYGARYNESRRNLLARINRLEGIEATTELVLSGSPRRWRRVLVVNGEQW